MKQVVFEAFHPGFGWNRLGTLAEVEPLGSVSSEPSTGPRQVYVFGWRDDQPGVWESQGGMDMATDAFRAITTEGLQQISDLSEPCELTIVRPTIGDMKVRFRLID